jgi:hypothetical protein
VHRGQQRGAGVVEIGDSITATTATSRGGTRASRAGHGRGADERDRCERGGERHAAHEVPAVVRIGRRAPRPPNE